MDWQLDQKVDLQRPVDANCSSGQFLYQGDHLAHMWRVFVYDNLKPVDLTGYSIVGYFNRYDGKTVPAFGSTDGNIASVVLPNGAYDSIGSLIGILRANKGDQIITLATCRWNVRKGHGDEIIDSDEIIPSIDELLAKIGEMEVQINATSAAVDNANKAVDAAKVAIQDANNATTTANQNAAAAQEAANIANIAATTANEAAGKANGATENANAATDRVNEAIQIANEAADRVDTVIEIANEAAANANAKATDATIAAEAANEAVKTINDKVDNAITPVIDEINFLHPLSITKFTVSPSMDEKGSTVGKETFTYGVNRMNVSLSLDGESVTGQTSERTDILTSDKTYTLSASLGSASVNATATISFVAPVYYGVGDTYDLNNDTVLALTRVLTKSRAKTITVNAGDGQYILYALPVALGTPVFKVGGFDGGFTLVGDFDFVNASGYMERYNLYRSVNSGLGNTTVVIS